jgi:hypothetical protein
LGNAGRRCRHDTKMVSWFDSRCASQTISTSRWPTPPPRPVAPSTLKCSGSLSVAFRLPRRPTVASDKTCTACSETKPLDAFSPHPKASDGRRSQCKRCLSKKAMAWRDSNRERSLDSHLRRTFGITLEQYKSLLELQDGGCAVCGVVPDVAIEVQRKQGIATRLVVDHCHDTGRVRGLLCASCNKGIGHLRDDPALLRLAVQYLEAEPRVETGTPEKGRANSWYERPPRAPECGHPRRPHKARGLCGSCYATWCQQQPGRRLPECGHPERPHASKGMCAPCYYLARKAAGSVP